MFDRNLVYGLSLVSFGSILSIASYFILENIPLTALGIGLIVLGSAWAMIPPYPLPKDTIIELIKSSCSNIEALLEALGIFEKAIYIPSKEGRVLAYVPIKKSGNVSIDEISNNLNKMIFKSKESLGIILAPPKAGIGNPHPVGEIGSDLTTLLEHALVDSEIASSVSAVQSEEIVVVEINKPKGDVDYRRFRIVMGSLPSCIAAQAVAAFFSKPVQIIEERKEGNSLIVNLKVLDWKDSTYI